MLGKKCESHSAQVGDVCVKGAQRSRQTKNGTGERKSFIFLNCELYLTEVLKQFHMNPGPKFLKGKGDRIEVLFNDPFWMDSSQARTGGH